MEGPVRPSVERPERAKHSSMIDQRSGNLADGEGKERNAVLYLCAGKVVRISTVASCTGGGTEPKHTAA
ncbi:hypothetical protein BHE74_00003399 [Ensete ventricosum]|nr:hypothetical protein BHE74_00003399 [Ensete ventricosum]RZR78696.1 hypothetical protein BHM03_00004118 [Ensete ventricosum]